MDVAATRDTTAILIANPHSRVRVVHSGLQHLSVQLDHR
jgi:hypothetical protein